MFISQLTLQSFSNVDDTNCIEVHGHSCTVDEIRLTASIDGSGKRQLLETYHGCSKTCYHSEVSQSYVSRTPETGQKELVLIILVMCPGYQPNV